MNLYFSVIIAYLSLFLFLSSIYVYICVSFDLKSTFSSQLFEPKLHVWLYVYIIIVFTG